MLPSPGLAPGESQRRVALFPLQLPAMDDCPVRQGGGEEEGNEGGLWNGTSSFSWLRGQLKSTFVPLSVLFVTLSCLLIQAHDESTPKLNKQTIPPAT